MIRNIDISPAAAEDVLLGIARHVPRDLVIGRPVAVAGRGGAVGDADVVLTVEPAAAWFLDGDGAARVLTDPDAAAGVDRWLHGEHVERAVDDPE